MKTQTDMFYARLASAIKKENQNKGESAHTPITLRTATESGMNGAYLHAKLNKTAAERDRLLEDMLRITNTHVADAQRIAREALARHK